MTGYRSCQYSRPTLTSGIANAYSERSSRSGLGIDDGRRRRGRRPANVSREESRMTGRRVLGIGLDPYTIDFDSDFFRGKPLNAAAIADGIKGDETRIRRWGTISNGC
jgi:hypothetical protein